MKIMRSDAKTSSLRSTLKIENEGKSMKSIFIGKEDFLISQASPKGRIKKENLSLSKETQMTKEESFYTGEKV